MYYVCRRLLARLLWTAVACAAMCSMAISPAQGQGLPADDSGVVGSSSVSAQLKQLYRASGAWRTSYLASPTAACRPGSGSLCAPGDQQDELTVGELQMAATPGYYDARQPRFTGPSQVHGPAAEQGGCFTCAAFSVVGAAEAAIASALQVNASRVRLSRQQLAFCLPAASGLVRNCRTAWGLREVISTLVAAFKGQRTATTAGCLPYEADVQAVKPQCQPRCGPPADDLEGLLNGELTGQRLQTAWEMQRHITLHGAVITRLTVYSDFRPFFAANRSGVYPGPGKGANKTEDHAVLLVGFDNDAEFWIAKNSWGPGFGDGGFFRISYGVSGVASFSDTYGLTWQPVTPPAQPRQLTPVAGKPDCYTYVGQPWDFVSRVANTFQVPIARVLLNNSGVIKDLRQGLGGVRLVLCGVPPDLVPPQTEVQALLQFKRQLDPGNPWPGFPDAGAGPAAVPGTNATGHQPPHCSWPGVTCHPTGHIKSLNFPSTFTGVLPSAATLLGLPHLEVLGLKQLAAQPMANGPLPPGWAAHPALHDIRLFDLALSGGLPDAYGSGFPRFKTLVAANCRLSGTLPASLSQLGLVGLNFSRNQLTGPLPAAWQQWGGGIQVVDLNSNKLSGTLPARYAAWRNLKFLNLSSNNISGTLPLSYSSMVKLQAVDLSNNRLTGSLPSAYGSMTIMKAMVLGNNALTGPLPASWSQWTALVAFLVYNNRFNGTLRPDYALWKGIMLADFSFNQLTGTLPESYGAWTQVVAVALDSNRLKGPLHASYGNWINAVFVSYRANQLSGTLPSSYAGMPSLNMLALSGNRFVGATLPPAWSRMHRLQYLELDNCGLAGGLPPSWSDMRSLTFMAAADNNITGPIPDTWSQLSALFYLDLSSNRLTGQLPTTSGALPNIRALLVGNNRLSGTLPAAVAAAPSLWQLDVSWNMLRGPLSDRWSQMLSTVLLAGNQSSGSIPPGLVGLPLLRQVSLHNNSGLMGCVPTSLERVGRSLLVVSPQPLVGANATTDAGNQRVRMYGQGDVTTFAYGAAAALPPSPLTSLEAALQGTQLNGLCQGSQVAAGGPTTSSLPRHL